MMDVSWAEEMKIRIMTTSRKFGNPKNLKAVESFIVAALYKQDKDKW
jgi:hypothetical protein